MAQKDSGERRNSFPKPPEISGGFFIEVNRANAKLFSLAKANCMKRWIVTGIIILGCSFLCWSQGSYCITLAGDTLVGKIRVEDNMVTLKQRKEERTLFPDELIGYYDENNQTYFYSKPVRYTENTVVYGFLKLEVLGAINLYSRVIKYTDRYSISFPADPARGNPASTFQGSRKIEETEYYLESDKAKIQLASRDVIYDFIRGDDQSTERVNDPNFKIEKHLKELITEYNGRH